MQVPAETEDVPQIFREMLSELCLMELEEEL